MVDEGCSFCVAVQHHGSQFGLPGAILAPGSASQFLTKDSTCCVAFRHRPRPSLSLTSACAPHPAPATGGDSVGQHFCISIYNKTNVLTIAFRLCLTFPTYAHAVHLSRCHSRTGSETNAHAQTYIYIYIYIHVCMPEGTRASHARTMLDRSCSGHPSSHRTAMWMLNAEHRARFDERSAQSTMHRARCTYHRCQRAARLHSTENRTHKPLIREHISHIT